MPVTDGTRVFWARGKLLLTGEYAVLDGALSFALPVKWGQSLEISAGRLPQDLITWTSLDDQQQVWFEGTFRWPSLSILRTSDQQVSDRLVLLLKTAQALAGNVAPENGGYAIQTRLEFNPQWGLGTSSTLVATVARWWEVDPYRLQWRVFGGSGYDIACAQAQRPILYQRRGETAQFVEHPWQSPAGLYGVYLGKKQNSRQGIARYRNRGEAPEYLLRRISELSLEWGLSADWQTCSAIMEEHETLIGQWLALPKVKETHFSDFPGAIKSLGAWGGDFVLVASGADPAELSDYFTRRGFPTMFALREMSA